MRCQGFVIINSLKKFIQKQPLAKGKYEVAIAYLAPDANAEVSSRTGVVGRSLAVDRAGPYPTLSLRGHHSVRKTGEYWYS